MSGEPGVGARVDDDSTHMRLALELALRGQGRTSPNPMVGAVVVQGGRVVGKGHHERAGGAHAEVAALNEAGATGAGATLYVTLEPCCFYGRTPPCVDLIRASGISRVVCAMRDPDRRASGRGIELLRRAGVEVRVGVLEPEAKQLNAFYVKHRTTGLPFVILKLAQSLDGRIATTSGRGAWITGEASRRRAHLLRSRVDAVLVGAGTVAADDPRLTVRMAEGSDPTRILVDSALRTPPGARIFGPGRTIVARIDGAGDERLKGLQGLGAEVWDLPSADGRVDLQALMAELGRRDFLSVMIEGGSKVAASALKAGIVDQVHIFIAPLVIGSGIPSIGDLQVERVDEAVRLANSKVERIGEDLLYIADVVRP